MNLANKGINIMCILCPTCDLQQEDVNPMFFFYEVAIHLRSKNVKRQSGHIEKYHDEEKCH